MNYQGEDAILPTKLEVSAFVADVLHRNDVDFRAFSDLTGIEITDNVVLEICRNNPNISLINLSRCPSITNTSLISVGDTCKNLIDISIEEWQGCNDIGFRSISLHCPNIVSFNCRGCLQVSDLSLRILAAGLKHIERLILTNCARVSDRGLSEIAYCCRKLKVLHLDGCFKIGESGDWSLAEVGKYCKLLEEIFLDGCIYVSDKGLTKIVRNCSSLSNLRLCCCTSLTQHSLREIIDAKLNINHIALSCNDRVIDDIVTPELVHSLSSHLHSLELSYCQLIGMRTFEAIEKCHNLKSLSLCGCKAVEDDVIRILSTGLQNLIKLDISHCDISDEGVNFLIPKTGGRGVSYLDLTGCAHVNTSYLNEVAPLFLFSHYVSTDTFTGFRPSESEYSTRKQMSSDFDRSKAALLIQRLHRGISVRCGIYIEMKKEYVVKNHLPKVQAYIRGNYQRKIVKEMVAREDFIRKVLRVQSVFRSYLNQKEYKRTLRKIKCERRRDDCASCIQRVYRSYLALKVLKDLRRSFTARQLRIHQYHAKREKASETVQKYFRSFVARKILAKYVQDRKNHIIAKIRMEASATVIQKQTRGFLGRHIAHLVRESKREYEFRWRNAIKIQAQLRGSKDRKQRDLLIKARDINKRIFFAIEIQRTWRGYKGYCHANYLKYLDNMEGCKERSSLIIQRIYRGMRSRRDSALRRLEVKEMKRREHASTNIQKVYRGFKCKEKLYILSALKSKNSNIYPLQLQLDEMKSQLAAMNQNMAELVLKKEEEESLIEKYKKELILIEKMNSIFVDSDALTGTLQRCHKDLVKNAIKQIIKDHEQRVTDMNKDHEQQSCTITTLLGRVTSLEDDISSLMEISVKKIKEQFRENRSRTDESLLRRRL